MIYREEREEQLGENVNLSPVDQNWTDSCLSLLFGVTFPPRNDTNDKSCFEQVGECECELLPPVEGVTGTWQAGGLPNSSLLTFSYTPLDSRKF